MLAGSRFNNLFFIYGNYALNRAVLHCRSCELIFKNANAFCAKEFQKSKLC